MMLKRSVKRGAGVVFSVVVMPVLLGISVLAYLFVFGDPSHFQGNDPANAPIPGDLLGIVYKGGVIVPILMTTFLLALTYTIERFIAIGRARGKGDSIAFLQGLKEDLRDGHYLQAQARCERQQGALGNVCAAVAATYAAVEADPSMTKEQKIVALQKEVEEATSLELPALEQNLVILSTISSIATLIGLLGTVVGMIKAFAALANAGAPDSVALSSGISEALVNTALGIVAAILSIIAYNFFTVQIDKITYHIDEAGYSIVQTYNEKH